MPIPAATTTPDPAPAGSDPPIPIHTSRPAAVSTASGFTLGVEHGAAWRADRDQLEDVARDTDAYAQFIRCFAGWPTVLRFVRYGALKRLAANEPVDPNDPAIWVERDAHATAVLRRHAITKIDTRRLTIQALAALIDGQRDADHEAGLDWQTITVPASALDDKLTQARRTLPINLADPSVWHYRVDQRRVLAGRLGLDAVAAEDLSRFTLAYPDRFEAAQLRCWRIGSATWLALADEQLAPVEMVERPVGVFVTPSTRHAGGWVLCPVLSLDMIRLVAGLGGRVDRTLTAATIPGGRIADWLALVNRNCLHAGERTLMESVGQLSMEVSKTLGHSVRVVLDADKRDRWGRLDVARSWPLGHPERQAAIKDLQLRVFTTAVHDFQTKRLGSRGIRGETNPSAVMELGEAVSAAIDRGLPLLLSTEAAGQLDGTIRVGRMKGRPGMVTITSSDGTSAVTRRLVAEQAVSQLRVYKAQGVSAVLDAGARQLLRMTLAPPLADDPILMPPQQEVAAKMAVGSGVNASQTGVGKTLMTARGAIYQRANTILGMRALVIADGRLIGQWEQALCHGAPARGLPALVPNAHVAVLREDASIAGQVRGFHRQLGDRPGVLLVANSLLDRYPADLAAINWHLLVADEAQRYTNAATAAHRALASLRFDAVADCWLLTATPKGKTAEHLDVLVGLAVGDRAMVTDRLNTREAGNLMDEVNAHRLRVNYGPHLVRVPRKAMAAYMPKVLPAQPLVIEADPALAELLEAIRQGGQGAYRGLLEVLKRLKAMEKGSAIYRQALAELARWQGMVLGNVGVFVDASVDPETLKHSDAALAKALDRQGLVDVAITGGGDGLPTLRGIVAQAIDRVSADEQVLVFADRVRCLHQLAGTLRDRHDVEAHVADGKLDDHQFETLKQRFTDGEFPVLCLSKVGHEGHDLQNASVIVHHDLPWLQTGLEQRVGRAARPGNTRGYVQTYIPYIKHGGIEHVVKILAERSAEHHQIMDSFDGVSSEESTLASQLGAITAQVADSKEQAGYAGTAAKLRVAAAVFGA